MEHNLFSPPEVRHTNAEADSRQTYPEAKNGKRFLNFLIDLVVIFIFQMIVGAIFGVLLVVQGREAELETMTLEFTLINVVVWLLYYGLMEGLFGLTIGKLITGTRVVDNYTHERPSFPRVMLRTLCRVIPFEHFSYFGNKPGGWHDHLSKTRTIDIRATPLLVAEYEEMRDLPI